MERHVPARYDAPLQKPLCYYKFSKGALPAAWRRRWMERHVPALPAAWRPFEINKTYPDTIRYLTALPKISKLNPQRRIILDFSTLI